MRMQSWLPAGALGAILGATIGWSAFHEVSQPFPHAKHAKLFPACGVCHGGITSGDALKLYPSRAVCVRCHDGTVVKNVSWTAPSRVPTNLRFSHVDHVAAAQNAGKRTTCETCHASAADTAYMHVGRADPSRCLSCHVANEHLGGGNACATCHVTLTEAKALPESVIAAFPKPVSHSNKNFIMAHAPKTATDLSSCATCHARESCARCHPNASRQATIASLESDARVANLVKGRGPVYPTPESHTSAEWVLSHGADAKHGASTCANCHTQESCTTCHIGVTGTNVIRALPSKIEGGGPGVRLEAVVPRGPGGPRVEEEDAGAEVALEQVTPVTPQQPVLVRQETTTVKKVTVHPPNFLEVHKMAASSGALNCQGCHQVRECTQCHSGTAPSRTYHPADFVSRHGTDAFRQSANCSTCHRVETFCRSCHQQTGMAQSTGAIKGSAHAGQPLWQLQHGQAARQGLTGCTSCHQQKDCLRCHSSFGQGISPHGSSFNARSVAGRNSQVCFACHATDPLKK